MFFRALLSLLLMPVFLCAGEPPVDQGFYAGYYEDLDWIQRNFEKALDRTFPLESFAVVSFRTWQEDGRIPEYSFVIHQQPHFQRLQATVRTSQTAPLLKQLLNLRRENRQTSIDALAADLQIEEQKVTSKTCPGILRAVADLSEVSVRIGSVKEETVAIHPVSFDFSLDLPSGTARVTLFDDFEHPLVEWAKATRRRLRECIEKQRPSELAASVSPQP